MTNGRRFNVRRERNKKEEWWKKEQEIKYRSQKDLKYHFVIGMHTDKFNIPRDVLCFDKRKERQTTSRLSRGYLACKPIRLGCIECGCEATRPRWVVQWNHLIWDQETLRMLAFSHQVLRVPLLGFGVVCGGREVR